MSGLIEMRVKIQNEQIVIGKQSLSFYGYYFDIEAHQDESSALTVMKKVLSQWAAALEALKDNAVAFLPYNLEDEWVECLEATRTGETILMRCVDVAANGYSLALDDLWGFMMSPQQLVDIRFHPGILDEYDREKIIAALRNAEVAAA